MNKPQLTWKSLTEPFRKQVKTHLVKLVYGELFVCYCLVCGCTLACLLANHSLYVMSHYVVGCFMSPYRTGKTGLNKARTGVNKDTTQNGN